MLNRKANRPAPKMPSGSYSTYRIASPVSTHYRPAVCPEIDCKAHREGWFYYWDDLTEELQYLYTHAGKRWEYKEINGSKAIWFPPGQLCFQIKSHVYSLERPEFHYVGRGDFRTFRTRTAQKCKPEEWQDRMASNLDELKTAFERG
jgi:hypothetical protein